MLTIRRRERFSCSKSVDAFKVGNGRLVFYGLNLERHLVLVGPFSIVT